MNLLLDIEPEYPPENATCDGLKRHNHSSIWIIDDLSGDVDNPENLFHTICALRNLQPPRRT